MSLSKNARDSDFVVCAASPRTPQKRFSHPFPDRYNLVAAAEICKNYMGTSGCNALQMACNQVLFQCRNLRLAEFLDYTQLQPRQVKTVESARDDNALARDASAD
jgi:hypothetical protein